MLEEEVAILNTWSEAMTPHTLGCKQVWMLLARKLCLVSRIQCAQSHQLMRVTAFMHSLIIEAYCVLHAGYTTLHKRTVNVPLLSWSIWSTGTTDSQTSTQTAVGFQLQCELRGALRVLTFEC